MNFQNNPSQSTLFTPCRKLDVILLTDNRDSNTQDRPLSDFRCSAFKETEVDPLEDRFKDVHVAESLDDLVKRVTRLEEKVEDLIKIQEGNSVGPMLKMKKQRRKFDEMRRQHKCKTCSRQYGSQTALKFHIKLKHPSDKEGHQ